MNSYLLELALYNYYLLLFLDISAEVVHAEVVCIAKLKL